MLLYQRVVKSFQEVSMQMHSRNRRDFSGRQEILKLVEVSPSLQLHLLIQGAEWMMSYLRNSRVLAIWNSIWTESSLTEGYSRVLILTAPVQERKSCW